MFAIDDIPDIEDNGSFVAELKTSFSLKQFTKLCLHIYGCQFFELLHHMPDVHTLEISMIEN